MERDTAVAPSNIVIIGGSYGGVSTAHYLLKHVVSRLPNKDCSKVVLISTSCEAMCRPACPRALISDDMFAQEKLFVGIRKVFEPYSRDTFRFIHGKVTALDHTNRSVTVALHETGTETIAYHAVVIATGASTPSPLLGVNQDASLLRASWVAFRTALPSAKRIVIAGGGPAGIETAGELGEYLNGHAGWFSRKLANPKVSITVVTSGSKILPVLRPSIAKKAEEFLAQVGVAILKDTRVVSVSPPAAGTDGALTTNATVTLQDGKTLEADLYIPATGTVPNTGFIQQALLASDDRVDTDPATLRLVKGGPRVYAIGDVGSHARPAVHNIVSSVPVLCANIKRDLLLEVGGNDADIVKDRIFKEDTRETQLVPIGKSKGVGSAMGFQLPSFLVWLIKGRDYWLWTTGSLWSGKQWSKES